jgi:hypothetical protein
MHKLLHVKLHSEANMKKEIKIMILIDDMSDYMEASEPARLLQSQISHHKPLGIR